MPIRCGIDIVHIPSLVPKLKSEITLRMMFHQVELKNSKLEHLAGVIAAKEAFFKTLGVRPKFLDVEVAYESSGRPYMVVSPEWQKFEEIDVSISHDQDYATAVVILKL